MSDLVSRQAVIDYLMINMGWHDADGYDVDDWSEKLPIVTDLINGVPSGWISVKDRPPESSGIKVIVSAKTVAESVLQTKAVFVAFLGYGDGKWYTPDVDFMTSAQLGDNHVHPVWEITHWMPLPEAPEEGEVGC